MSRFCRALSCTLFAALVVTIAWTAVLAQPAPADTDRESDLQNAYDQLSGGAYSQGIASFQSVLAAFEDPVERSHVSYLMARAAQESGDCQTAITRYRALQEAAEPDDPWIPRARFGQAECLLSEGDPEEALALFVDEAERLLQPEHTDRLAEILIGYAREAMARYQSGHSAEWANALTLYRLVLTLAPGGDLEDEAEHFVAAGISGAAPCDELLLEMRIRRNPSGRWACADRLALARARQDSRGLWHVVQQCEAPEAFQAAAEIDGLFGGLWAVNVMETALTRFPDEESVSELRSQLALRLIEVDRAERAWEALQLALDGSDGSALRLLLDAASVYSRNLDGDRARQLWQQVQELSTRATDLERVRREWSELRVREAILAGNSGDLELALQVLAQLAEEVPAESARARTLAGQLLAREGRWEEARDALVAAGTDPAIQLLVELLEERGLMEQAQPFRAQLGLGERYERLQVAVPGWFGVSEAPHLIVRTDGLAEIELRFHPIDVEDHLRSMGSLHGLSALDVDLIAPQATRRVALEAPRYEGYRRPGPTLGQVDLGPLAPGVYAIQVTGESQQAVALVRVSDIAVTAREVAGDLVVLVVDRIAGEPVEDARIVVSDGSRILEEGETDRRGVFRAEVPPGSLEILAMRDDEVAWVELAGSRQTSAADIRTQLNEQRHVSAWLDRDQATPGETISYLAFVSLGESPRLLPTETIQVGLYSGSVLLEQWEEPVTGGLLQGRLTLPDRLPPGRYGIDIGGQMKPLQVDSPGPRTRTVRVRQPRPVRPGGIAKVGVELLGPNGRPLAGEEIEGDLADGQGMRVLGRTDEDGALWLWIPLDEALPAPRIRLAGTDHTVRTIDIREEPRLELDDLSPGSATNAELTWSDGGEADVFMRLVRVDDLQPPQVPLLASSWWPDSPSISRSVTIDIDHQRLTDGHLTMALPPLESGRYRLVLELVRQDGQGRVVERTFTVSASNERHELRASNRDSSTSQPLMVEYTSPLAVACSSPSTQPMLLTVEGSGIFDVEVVRAGQTSALDLPETLVGEGRLVLTGVSIEGSPPSVAILPLVVERRIDLDLSLQEESGTRAIQVIATDRTGDRVEASVLVAMLPADSKAPDATSAIFPLSVRALSGTASEAPWWSEVFSTYAVDSEILDLRAEQALARQQVSVIDLGRLPYELPAQTVPADFGSIGFGASGGGGYGFGRSPNIEMGEVRIAPYAQGISPRHTPALWVLGRTGTDGRLRVDVPEASLESGWYRLTAVVLEGAGESPHDRGDRGRSPTDPPSPLAHQGTLVQRGIWIDEPLPRAVTEPGPVRVEGWETRCVVEPGEEVVVETAGAQWLQARVAPATPDELIAVLLEPDLAGDREMAFWYEQQLAFELLSQLQLDTPDAPRSIGLRRWIAEQRLAATVGERPLALQPMSTLLRRIEQLAEDRVSERAEVLLGLGRQSPGHSQAAAALLRLSRNPAAREPDVVGTLALATLLLAEDGRDTASALVPDLERAVREGSLLGQARALEALARLERPIPVDPRDLLHEIPASASSRVDIDVPAILGSLTRVLLLEGVAFDETPGSLHLEADSSSATELPAGRHLLALEEGRDSVTVSAEEGAVALRLVAVSENEVPHLGITLQRVAQRHGPWFRGQDIVPPDDGRVEQAAQGVVGRRLRVRLELLGRPPTGSSEVTLEEFLPPGTQLVPGSVNGFRLIAQDGDRLILRGRMLPRAEVSYQVEILHATRSEEDRIDPLEPTWRPAVLRSSGGVTLTVGGQNRFDSVDANVERNARLSGEPIMPVEATELTIAERLALGVALQHSNGTDTGLLGQAVDLLMPLLHGGELTSEQVQQAGEAAFRAALQLEYDTSVQEVFSILEARAPRATIRLEELIQVARTFRRQNEVTYALRAYRALLNLRFLAEVNAGEGLLDLGYTEQGLRFIHDSTRAYPDIPSVVESMFNLPQLLLDHAQTLPDTPDGRFQARRFRLTASRWLAEYLIRYGTEERADQAALIQLNVVQQLEDWERLIQLGEAFAGRYPQTHLLDSFLFLRAYAHQRRGELDQASRLYQRVAEEMFSGRFSSDTDRARLAVAQIHHATGELEEAIEVYRQVEATFPDARAALRTLENPELRAPSVVTTWPGQRLDLPLRVRGVEELHLWAYPVDLERLFLREKQVRAVEDISLAGIEPVIQATVELPANFGTLAEHHVDLRLSEPGAYLVLLRGPTVRTSTLAIVSDLQLDIVDDIGSNTLHVSVLDRHGVPREGAIVRVSWPGAMQTDSARSDLRGLVRLEGYDGSAHVLARVDDSYAVYRGAAADDFDMPSQIDTGWGVGYYPMQDDLLEGQRSRASEVQRGNIDAYEQRVLRNDRTESNFELW